MSSALIGLKKPEDTWKVSIRDVKRIESEYQPISINSLLIVIQLTEAA
jgi:hypothetical protein